VPAGDGDGDEEGVSMGGTVDKASLSDSTLTLVPVSSPPFTILEGVEGETGDEGASSKARWVRRLIVTLLDVGSGRGWSESIRLGVRGGAMSSSLLVRSLSRGGVDGGAEPDSPLVSADLLRESPRETR
jgi:hypothetical protein